MVVKPESVHQQVQQYYGETLATSADLKTSACCCDSPPARITDVLMELEPELLKKFYGCGSPIPLGVEGCTVLDLGCGAGRDSYVLSKLVGPRGRVIGVDMTAAQIDFAKRFVEPQTKRFGYARPNIEFRSGLIENLAALGIEDASIDVVTSNCVINLSPDKERVFSEIFRVLKPGGELYFSDVFAGRRVPPHLQHDAVLRGECLAGALYLEDFRRLLRRLGCLDYRVMSARRIALENREIEARIGMVDFYSMTIRAFRLELEDLCEDYGQVATYLGTLADSPHAFALDDHHTLYAGKPMLVCGNTAAMLGETRFAPHFRIDGDRTTHFGKFDCAPAASPVATRMGVGGACC